jgi:hypothetical protein
MLPWCLRIAPSVPKLALSLAPTLPPQPAVRRTMQTDGWSFPPMQLAQPVVRTRFRRMRRLDLQSDGRTLPSFVTDELHDFMGCGVLARGFAQLFCKTCHERYVVA